MRKNLIYGGAAVAGSLLASWYLRERGRIDLDGQVVLITGGSRGLGLALAEEFASRGARLVICARNPADLQGAADRLERQGADVLAIPCDVTDPEQVGAMIDQATRHYGGVDVLVNNAGTIMVGPFENQTVEDFRTAMDTMFWGLYHTTMAVLPQMRERHAGRIVNITSIGARFSMPHLLSYNSAKFAASGFSEGLRAELVKDGIKVTTVAPGLMRTGSFTNAVFKGQHRGEYTWFSLGSSLPLISVGADKAARQIADATEIGRADLTISMPALLAARLHGVFPGATANLLGAVNRVLPGPGDSDTEYRLGKESDTVISESFLTALGRDAAEQYNQNE